MYNSKTTFELTTINELQTATDAALKAVQEKENIIKILSPQSDKSEITTLLADLDKIKIEIDNCYYKLHSQIIEAYKWLTTYRKKLLERTDINLIYENPNIIQDIQALFMLKEGIQTLLESMNGLYYKFLSLTDSSMDQSLIHAKTNENLILISNLETIILPLSKYTVATTASEFVKDAYNTMKDEKVIDNALAKSFLNKAINVLNCNPLYELIPDNIASFLLSAQKIINYILLKNKLSAPERAEFNKCLEDINREIDIAKGDLKHLYYNIPLEFFYELKLLEFECQEALLHQQYYKDRDKAISLYNKVISLVNTESNPIVYYYIFSVEIARKYSSIVEIMDDLDLNKDDQLKKLNEFLNSLTKIFNNTKSALLEKNNRTSIIENTLEPIASVFLEYCDQQITMLTKLVHANVIKQYSKKCLTISDSNYTTKSKNSLLIRTHDRFNNILESVRKVIEMIEINKAEILQASLLSNPSGLELIPVKMLHTLKQDLQAICTEHELKILDLNDIMISPFEKEVVEDYIELAKARSVNVLNGLKECEQKVTDMYVAKNTITKKEEKQTQTATTIATTLKGFTEEEIERNDRKHKKKHNNKGKKKTAWQEKRKQEKEESDVNLDKSSTDQTHTQDISLEERTLEEARQLYIQGKKDKAEEKLELCASISEKNKNWSIALAAKHASISYSLINIEENKKRVITYDNLKSKQVSFHSKIDGIRAIITISNEIDSIKEQLNKSSNYIDFLESNTTTLPYYVDNEPILKSIKTHRDELTKFTEEFEAFLINENQQQEIGKEEFKQNNPMVWNEGDARRSTFVEARKAREQCIQACSKLKQIVYKVKRQVKEEDNYSHSHNTSTTAAPITTKSSEYSYLQTFLTLQFTSKTDKSARLQNVTYLYNAANDNTFKIPNFWLIKHLREHNICDNLGKLDSKAAEYIRNHLKKHDESGRFEYQSNILSL